MKRDWQFIASYMWNANGLEKVCSRLRWKLRVPSVWVMRRGSWFPAGGTDADGLSASLTAGWDGPGATESVGMDGRGWGHFSWVVTRQMRTDFWMLSCKFTWGKYIHIFSWYSTGVCISAGSGNVGSFLSCVSVFWGFVAVNDCARITWL